MLGGAAQAPCAILEESSCIFNRVNQGRLAGLAPLPAAHEPFACALSLGLSTSWSLAPRALGALTSTLENLVLLCLHARLGLSHTLILPPLFASDITLCLRPDSACGPLQPVPSLLCRAGRAWRLAGNGSRLCAGLARDPVVAVAVCWALPAEFWQHGEPAAD